MSDTAGRSRGRRPTGWLSAATIALAAALGPAAALGAEAPAAPTQAEAVAALEAAQEALAGGTAEEAHPTLELRDLALALPELRGRERREAKAVLSRPPKDEGLVEPFGAEWSVGTDSPHYRFRDTPHFRIHWLANGEHAPPSSGYVDKVETYAEASYAKQNDELGWPAPERDGSRGGNGKVDIYLSDICDEAPGALCIFGYAGVDDPTMECVNAFRCAAFLVLDNDYSLAEFGYEDPDVPLQVTMAHEYNHVLQFGIDAFQDIWMFESTAVWVEDHVFPDADDWVVSYIPAWADQPHRPITSDGGLRMYGTAVWNHWLTRRFGPAVVRLAWKKSRKSRPRHYAVGAYNLAIKQRGGPGFSREFGRFATATSEWLAGSGGFRDREHPVYQAEGDVSRQGSLAPGQAVRFRLDHTAYRLLDVSPGSGGRTLRVRAARGTRTAFALVGRSGPIGGGAVTRKLKYLPRGGRARVTLPEISGFDRITAVVVNADGRVRGWGGWDWNYTRDDRAFRAILRAG